MSMNETVTDLQTRLAFLEDLLDSLNGTVAEQSKVIATMTRKLVELEGQLRQLGDSARVDARFTDPPPPHY